MLQPNHTSVPPFILNAKKEDGLTSQAMRSPRDQSPEDGKMPGQFLGVHGLILVTSGPWIQPSEQEQPLKNPNEVPIKAYRFSLCPPHPRAASDCKVHADVLLPWLSSYHVWHKECLFSQLPLNNLAGATTKGILFAL